MSKLYVSIMMVALLALVCTGVWAVDLVGGGSDSDTIDVDADITAAAQVLWQDLSITLDDNAFWANTLEGDYYLATTTGDDQGNNFTDAWAGWDDGTYFEDYDPTSTGDQSNSGARLYLKSNVDLTVAVTTSNGLTNTGDSNCKLDSWYTLAGYGEGSHGFLEECGTVDHNDGTIPQSTVLGSYLKEDPTATLDWGPWLPNQDAIDMDGSTETLSLEGTCEGGLNFHVRVLREAMNDAAGSYTGTIDVTVTAGSSV